MFILTILIALFYISQSSIIIECDKGQPCTVDGNSSLVVIAPCGVNLVVNCDDPNQCKRDGLAAGLIVYSSGNSTEINCNGPDSCEGIELNFGFKPVNALASDFECTRSSVNVNCLGKQSCKTITINNKGTVVKGLKIVTPTDTSVNKGAFMQGFAICGFDTECTVECGNDKDTCKDGKCYDNCNCLGSACPNDINQRPTSKPTSPPTNSSSHNSNSVQSTLPPVPTPKPTPEPTDSRNETICEVNNCILEPGNNFDVICPENIETCNIECNGIAQCQDGVIIVAESKNVNLLCAEVSSCGKVQLFNTKASAITIDIQEEKGGTNMFIDIGNEGSTLTVNVNGQGGFGTGTLICDGTCNLNCNELNSCENAKYECLTPSTQCGLTCDTNNGNLCPSINDFGTPSCITPDCTIIADGNTRIVALNDVDVLTVVCNENSQQCKKRGNGLQVFSAANVTRLLCNTKDGCEDAFINIGPLTGSYVPKGFKASDFDKSFDMVLDANCDGESACKGVNIYTTGNTKSVINGDGVSALQDSTSICDGCAELTVNCREFDGCFGSNIFCTNDLDCSCINAFEVDIGNNTADLATTQRPRDSCPYISPYFTRNGIASINKNVNNVVNKGINFSIGALIPITIIAGIIMIAGVAIYKKNKKYASINGIRNNNKYMLKNENIYSTYQVEME